jgi:hypothetical protein
MNDKLHKRLKALEAASTKAVETPVVFVFDASIPIEEQNVPQGAIVLLPTNGRE